MRSETRRRLRAALLGSIVWLATAIPLSAADARVPKTDFHDVRLENGLRVLLVEDHSAPVISIAVTYNVGSRNERPGRTGFAHLFEHMMFKGSENVGTGEHFVLIFNNGGSMNGTTSEDRTNYFETLPANQLDLALFLEADRMRSLALSDENLDNQRNAVQEERRLRVDNQPYGKSYLEIDNLAYDNFAYKHSVIGSMEDLDAATLEDVREFFRIYYAPNNAVVSLAGDFDLDECLEKVKKYFGGIPSQPAAPQPRITEPEHYGERRTTIHDPLARLPQILMAYHIPRGNTEENYALSVLDSVLGSGRSSRFYQRLVKEKQLARRTSVQADNRRGPSLFYIMATPRPGVPVEDLEKAILEELAEVQQNGITEQELEKAQAQIRRRAILGLRSSLATARRLGEYVVKFDDPNLINTLFDKYAAVTRDAIQEAAKQYLIEKNRTVVITQPAQRSGPAGGARPERGNL